MKRSPVAPLATFPARARTVTSYQWHQARRSWAWLVGSHEYTNFTYELTTENVAEMAWFVAAVTGLGFSESFGYIEELHDDQALLGHLRRAVADSPLRRVMDLEPRYGRRAAWYAIVRATRPRHVVETGVDKGLGSCVFAAALLRNADEGHHGRLTALDINRDAGALIGGEYASVIDLRFGDSIAILAASASPVDLFLHDSDHRYNHESAEYRAIARSLTESALVMTDHGGLALSDFAKSSGRRFLVFREDPADHWAPGGVLGVAMNAATQS
ncbi:MAG: class I SAM-dependent methyltransferase [Acidimicrobiales bacterium]